MFVAVDGLVVYWFHSKAACRIHITRNFARTSSILPLMLFGIKNESDLFNILELVDLIKSILNQ